MLGVSTQVLWSQAEVQRRWGLEGFLEELALSLWAWVAGLQSQ